MGNAPYVLRLHGCKYDVGLYDDGKGGYEARTDFWGGHVRSVLGLEAPEGGNKEAAMMGRLYQTYGIHAAMEQARRKGYTTRRVAMPDGSVNLEITGV